MRAANTVRGAIALVVVGVAVVGYVLFIPMKVLHPNLLSRLVVATSGLPGIAPKPTFSAALPTASSSLSGVVSAAAESPGKTGSYASDWFGPVKQGSSVTLEVNLLPSVASATGVLKEATTQDAGTTALRAGQHVLQARFSTASGSGATYLTARPKAKSGITGPPVPGTVLDERVGRVVLRVTLTGPVATKVQALTLAAAETALVTKVEPSFPSIQSTHIPLIASIVYGVLTLLVAIAFALIPDWVRFVRKQRRAQQEARLRRQYHVRGSKALRRHRVRI